MSLLGRKIAAFLKKVSDLPDRPSPAYSATEIKAQFDSSPEELRVAHNGLIDDLASTTPGSSGAEQVGSAPIAGVAGATPYAQIASLKTLVDGSANQNAFSTVAVPGQPNLVSDSPSDTLTVTSGTGISITTDAATDTLTITATGTATPGPHANSHISGGADVIPTAVSGGSSGLMSGADKARLDAAVTNSGAQNISGTLTTTSLSAGSLSITGSATANDVQANNQITISASAPILKFVETDGAADAKKWRMVIDGGQLQIRAINDAESAENNFFALTRSGLVATGNNTLDNGSGNMTAAGAGTFNGGLISGWNNNRFYPGDQDHVYLAFHARTASPATRSAYMGYGGAASANFTISNEIAGGNVELSANAGYVKSNNDILMGYARNIILSTGDVRQNLPTTDAPGGWAKGHYFYNQDGGTIMGAFGMFGAGASADNIFIGHGGTAYAAGTSGIRIEPSGAVKTKNNIADAGNGDAAIVGNLTYKGAILPAMRVNSGVVEWYDGTGWKSLGNNQLYKASTNQKVSLPTEQLIASQQYRLVGIFYATTVGEVRIACDLKTGSTSTPTAELQAFTDAGGYTRGGSSTAYSNNRFLNGPFSSAATPLPFDTSQVVGTEYSNTVVEATGTNSLDSPGMWYDNTSLYSSSSSSYASFSAILKITKPGPVYLLLKGETSGGSTSVGSGVKNITISYDLQG